MNHPTIPQSPKPEEAFCFTRYIAAPPRWQLLIPDFTSSMTTITLSFVMLLTGAGLMMSEVQQLMLIGACTIGSTLGSVFQVLRSLVKKTEEEVPRQILLYRFSLHVSGGIFSGTGVCLVLLYWFQLELPLILMGVVSGGFMGWLCESLAKKFEPKIIKMLEDAGRIVRPNPPDAITIDLTPPTVRLAPETKKLDL